MLFHLPDHGVLDAVDLPVVRRRVLMEHTVAEGGSPSCGTLSDRVHQRTRQRLRRVPIAGPATGPEVVLVRRRFACIGPRYPRKRFVEVSDQIPLLARATAHLPVAVVGAGRVVAEVAGAQGVSW